MTAMHNQAPNRRSLMHSLTRKQPILLVLITLERLIWLSAALRWQCGVGSRF